MSKSSSTTGAGKATTSTTTTAGVTTPGISKGSEAKGATRTGGESTTAGAGAVGRDGDGDGRVNDGTAAETSASGRLAPGSTVDGGAAVTGARAAGADGHDGVHGFAEPNLDRLPNERPIADGSLGGKPVEGVTTTAHNANAPLAAADAAGKPRPDVVAGSETTPPYLDTPVESRGPVNSPPPKTTPLYANEPAAINNLDGTLHQTVAHAEDGEDLGTPRRGNDDEFSEALLRSAGRRGRPSAKIGALFLLLGEELDGPPDGSTPGMTPAQVEEVLQSAVDTARNIRKRDQKAVDNGLVSVTLTRHAYGANPGESIGLPKDKADLLIRSGGAALTEKKA